MTEALKWTSEQITVFLNIYRMYECLWDVRSANYLKRDAKKQAMTELLKTLELNGLSATEDLLKKKIKNIRDAYRHELNKVKKSKKSGAGASDIYKPKLAWFGVADAFWNSVVSGRQSSSSMELDTQGEDDSVDEPDIEIDNDPSHEQVPCASTTPTVPSFVPSQPRKRSSTTMPPPTAHKAVKTGLNTKYPSRFETALGKLENIAHLVKEPSGEEDQYSRFAEHIAAQLRELPMRSFINLQTKIQELISNERLRVMDEAASFSPSTSSSSISEIYVQTSTDVPLGVDASGLVVLQKTLLEGGEIEEENL